jgi:transcription-repair coupling factor (superfamily II helicase)
VSLSDLLDVVSGDPSLARALQTPTAPVLDLTGPAGLRPFVLAGLVRRGRTVLAVTATGREAEDLVAALAALVDGDRVALYPSWETLPHERLSPRADTVGRRLAVLRRLAHPNADDPATGPLDVVVAPVRSLLQPQVPGLGDLEPVALGAGQDVGGGLDAVVRRLVDISYARVELVEKRGEFAVRGGILDVFPPTEEHPVRVEWWGDSVEEVRSFKVADQRSLQQVGHGLWAPPCRELLLTPEVRARAKELAATHPELARSARDRRRPPGRGHGGARPRARSTELRLLVDELPPSTSSWSATREGAHPRARPGAHQPGVPRGVLGDRSRGRAAPIDLGACRLPHARGGARARRQRSACRGGRSARSPLMRTSTTTSSCSPPSRRRPTAARIERAVATCASGRRRLARGRHHRGPRAGQRCTSCSRTPKCLPGWTTRPASEAWCSSRPAAWRPGSAATCCARCC